MGFIDFIRDPRANVPGVNLLHDGATSIRRSKEVLFSDDPFGLGKKIPKMPSIMDISDHVLAMDSRWTLDGHRFFINKEIGFFLDRIFALDVQVGRTVFSTDRDTALGYDFYSGRYTLNQDKIGKKENVVFKGRLGVALSAEPSNWGSFIARCAPKAAVLRDYDCDYILAYCAHKQQHEMLRMLGWKDSEIINYDPSVNYLADEFVYPSEAARDLFVSPQSASHLRKLSRSCEGRKIFISRRSGIASRSGRECLNAVELESAIVKRGFQIVTPDEYTLREQINIFSESDFVVGPAGAALFNTIFCENNTKLIDVESVSNWIYGHVNLFSSYGLDFGVNWGEPKPGDSAHLPFNVDVECLMSRVEQML